MPLYKLEIWKSYGSRSTRDNWRNTHEFELGSEITSPEMATAVEQFVDFEARLHASSVQFMRGVVHLMDGDNDGYVPEEVRVLDVSGQGSRAAAGENVLDTNLVLAVKRFGNVGRSGYLYLRGCLFETDVNSDSRGFAGLTSDAELALTALLTQGSPDYFNGPKLPQLISQKITGNPPNQQVVTNARTITSLQITGVKLIPRNHRWFNRGLQP